MLYIQVSFSICPAIGSPDIFYDKKLQRVRLKTNKKGHVTYLCFVFLYRWFFRVSPLDWTPQNKDIIYLYHLSWFGTPKKNFISNSLLLAPNHPLDLSSLWWMVYRWTLSDKKITKRVLCYNQWIITDPLF